MNVLDYIKPELLILIPTCWGIGLVIRASSISNKWIPLILCICSVVLASLYVMSESEPVTIAIFTAITQGVVAWLIAWVTYEKGIKAIQLRNQSKQ